jgi:UV DNA damage endonuclease
MSHSHSDYHFVRDWDSLRGRLNLGLCCINTILRTQKPSVFCSRHVKQENYTVEKAKELALQNVKDIIPLIEWNQLHGIRCLRLSSDIFPHFTNPETEPYTIDFARDDLKLAGDLSKKYGHRIVMHPAQFNQVGAKDSYVFRKTFRELQHHAEILDAMGIDDNGVLIVHGGGTYGDKESTIKRWISQFKTLPECVRRRLVIENCERQYSVTDCLRISRECGIPVVFDFHHYECMKIIYPEIKHPRIDEFIGDVILSWGNRRVLMHVSEQGSGKIGHHSDYIENLPHELLNTLEDYPDLVVDLEVEAKKKESAIMRLYAKYPELFQK